jgi:hypothetical protein
VFTLIPISKINANPLSAVEPQEVNADKAVVVMVLYSHVLATLTVNATEVSTPPVVSRGRIRTP